MQSHSLDLVSLLTAEGAAILRDKHVLIHDWHRLEVVLILGRFHGGKRGKHIFNVTESARLVAFCIQQALRERICIGLREQRLIILHLNDVAGAQYVVLLAGERRRLRRVFTLPVHFINLHLVKETTIQIVVVGIARCYVAARLLPTHICPFQILNVTIRLLDVLIEEGRPFVEKWVRRLHSVMQGQVRLRLPLLRVIVHGEHVQVAITTLRHICW